MFRVRAAPLLESLLLLLLLLSLPLLLGVADADDDDEPEDVADAVEVEEAVAAQVACVGMSFTPTPPQSFAANLTETDNALVKLSQGWTGQGQNTGKTYSPSHARCTYSTYSRQSRRGTPGLYRHTGRRWARRFWGWNPSRSRSGYVMSELDEGQWVDGRHVRHTWGEASASVRCSGPGRRQWRRRR